MADRIDLERRDKRMGLTIVGVAFLAALCVSWWARTTAAPPAPAPAPPTTVGVVGFPKKVDTVATLDNAQKLTDRTQLRGISAWGVASDGTVDVSLPGNRIRYVFMSPRGQGPQPPRPPGTLPRRDTCGRQNIHVKESGMVADPDQPAAPCAPTMTEALPAPRCGPRDVFQRAIRNGFRPDASANVEYYRATVGPAWRIDQPATHKQLVLYGDCERELVGSDGFGSIP